MRARIETNADRTNLSIRTDIKAAMDYLRMRRCREEGCYVSLGKLFGEAALRLLESEGIDVKVYDQQPQPVALQRKPPKSVARKQRARMAG